MALTPLRKDIRDYVYGPNTPAGYRDTVAELLDQAAQNTLNTVRGAEQRAGAYAPQGLDLAAVNNLRPAQLEALNLMKAQADAGPQLQQIQGRQALDEAAQMALSRASKGNPYAGIAAVGRGLSQLPGQQGAAAINEMGGLQGALASGTNALRGADLQQIAADASARLQSQAMQQAMQAKLAELRRQLGAKGEDRIMDYYDTLVGNANVRKSNEQKDIDRAIGLGTTAVKAAATGL